MLGEREEDQPEHRAAVLGRRERRVRAHALLGVQLDQLAGLLERDERDLERCLLGAGEVPGCEGALRVVRRVRPSEVTNIRSHMCGASVKILRRPAAPMMWASTVDSFVSLAAPSHRPTMDNRS